MKKVLLSAAFIAANFVAFAQETSSDGFTPVAGDKTFEVSASSPFQSANPFSLNGGSLRFRYFLSEKMAFRVNFSLSSSSSSRVLSGGTTTVADTDPANSATVGTQTLDEVKASTSSFGLTISPGIEFHKTVAKRVDVYYGALLNFGLTSGSAKAEITSAGRSIGATNDNFAGTYTYEVSNGQFNVNSLTYTQGSGNINGLGNNTPAGGMNIGLSGLLGADYYFTKAIYLGLEVQYGFLVSSNSAIKVTETNSIRPATATTSFVKTETKETNQGSSFSLLPSAQASFRLGVKF